MRDPHHMNSPERAGLADSAFGALHHMIRITKLEWQLVKHDLSDSMSKIVMGVAFIIGAVIFALIGLFILAAAAVAALVEMGFSVALSALAVGGALFVIALILAFVARASFRKMGDLPKRSFDNIQRDFQAVKEGINA